MLQRPGSHQNQTEAQCSGLGLGRRSKEAERMAFLQKKMPEQSGLCSDVVRLTGVEPVRPSGHKHLKLASLPIPAQPHIESFCIGHTLQDGSYYNVQEGICQLPFLHLPKSNFSSTQFSKAVTKPRSVPSLLQGMGTESALLKNLCPGLFRFLCFLAGCFRSVSVRCGWPELCGRRWPPADCR